MGKHLDPVLFQQPADVPDRFIGFQPNDLPGSRCHSLGPTAVVAANLAERLAKGELGLVAEDVLQLGV